MLVTYARQDDPRFLHRADPAYWHPAYEGLWAGCGWSRRPLGEFITHLAYGPIITGRRPPTDPAGVALVNQGQIGLAGVDLSQAQRVPVGCPWDQPRVRLQPGDIVLARSGAGSVARNRLAVYCAAQAAVVGSFVDLMRVVGLDPIYVTLFLKTCYGWGQIHRLVNGVATPNLSFPEIRGLEIALAPEDWQAAWRDRYRSQVLPLHAAQDPRAGQEFWALVHEVEQALRGGGLAGQPDRG